MIVFLRDVFLWCWTLDFLGVVVGLVDLVDVEVLVADVDLKLDVDLPFLVDLLVLIDVFARAEAYCLVRRAALA